MQAGRGGVVARPRQAGPQSFRRQFGQAQGEVVGAQAQPVGRIGRGLPQRGPRALGQRLGARVERESGRPAGLAEAELHDAPRGRAMQALQQQRAQQLPQRLGRRADHHVFPHQLELHPAGLRGGRQAGGQVFQRRPQGDEIAGRIPQRILGRHGHQQFIQQVQQLVAGLVQLLQPLVLQGRRRHGLPRQSRQAVHRVQGLAQRNAEPVEEGGLQPQLASIASQGALRSAGLALGGHIPVHPHASDHLSLFVGEDGRPRSEPTHAAVGVNDAELVLRVTRPLQGAVDARTQRLAIVGMDPQHLIVERGRAGPARGQSAQPPHLVVPQRPTGRRVVDPGADAGAARGQRGALLVRPQLLSGPALGRHVHADAAPAQVRLPRAGVAAGGQQQIRVLGVQPLAPLRHGQRGGDKPEASGGRLGELDPDDHARL